MGPVHNGGALQSRCYCGEFAFALTASTAVESSWRIIARAASSCTLSSLLIFVADNQGYRAGAVYSARLHCIAVYMQICLMPAPSLREAMAGSFYSTWIDRVCLYVCGVPQSGLSIIIFFCLHPCYAE